MPRGGVGRLASLARRVQRLGRNFGVNFPLGRQYRSKSRSTGVPEPDDDEAILETDETDEADGAEDGDPTPTAAICLLRLKDKTDEAKFASFLCARCAPVYWGLVLLARCACLFGLAPTGVGQSGPGQALTAIMVCGTTTLFFVPPATRRKWVDRTPWLILGQLMTTYAIRAWRLAHMPLDYDVDDEMREILEYFATDAFRVHMAVSGLSLPLICGGAPGFQALFLGLNIVCASATSWFVGLGGRDTTMIAKLFALNFVAVVAGNGLVYGVLKPLWVSGSLSTNEADLQRRIDQLTNEKERITWEWQLDAMRTREAEDERAARRREWHVSEPSGSSDADRGHVVDIDRAGTTDGGDSERTAKTPGAARLGNYRGLDDGRSDRSAKNPGPAFGGLLLGDLQLLPSCGDLTDV